MTNSGLDVNQCLNSKPEAPNLEELLVIVGVWFWVGKP